jgi:hypothetical protein
MERFLLAHMYMKNSHPTLEKIKENFGGVYGLEPMELENRVGSIFSSKCCRHQNCHLKQI